jgi:aryl-alcohol dehydrogenase-like predicted oxidoreductase
MSSQPLFRPRRALGHTGFAATALGIGDLADRSLPLEACVATVRRAIDAGLNLIDTAPGYGNGVSEDLLGQGLELVRKDVIICTKFGYSPEGVENFSTDNIRPILEGSLRRLRTDYVDILLLHNPSRELMDGRTATQYAELERLKKEGKIREYGVSLDWKVELETVIETTRSNAIELMYNVFYQEPRDAFIMAMERGAGLIVKVPLDSGWLSGRYRGDSRFTDVRQRWSPEVIARR